MVLEQLAARFASRLNLLALEKKQSSMEPLQSPHPESMPRRILNSRSRPATTLYYTLRVLAMNLATRRQHRPSLAMGVAALHCIGSSWHYEPLEWRAGRYSTVRMLPKGGMAPLLNLYH